MPASTTDGLLARFRAGDRRACARVASLVENEAAEAVALLDELYPSMGRAYRVGITGPPGAGKSSLVEKLALECRQRGRTVGIVAVDPSSPFSGGAVLGDRVRMPALFIDPGVFIRSMATRGGLGGLATRTKEVCDVLDAFGYDFIIIETVGVGQVELDIAATAYTTVVVLVPESGDSIQMMKAGLMEIGDVFAVNKSDREGADRVVLEVETVLQLRRRDDGWQPPVLKTVATRGDGVRALLDEIDRHRALLEESRRLADRRCAAVQDEIRELVEHGLRREVWTQPEVGERLARLVEAIVAGRSSPYRAAEEILAMIQATGNGKRGQEAR